MFKRFFTLLIALPAVVAVTQAQTSHDDEQIEILSDWTDDSSTEPVDSSTIYAPDGRRWDEMRPEEAVGFALDTLVKLPPIPPEYFMPAIYSHFEFVDSVKLLEPLFSGRPELRWIEEQNVVARSIKQSIYNFYFKHPDQVKYNISMMRQAPKQYHATIDPTNHTVQINEQLAGPVDKTTLIADKVKRRHWIRNFNASLQFSQAYVSPNWYQGGNNNLNMLAQIYYNVKLNQEYHPNLLLDFTAQYKLGMNSAPDDTLRNYSISDDLFQLNTTFGVKAAKRWYYSFTGQFKTQLLNSYKSNTNDLRSAFLSPAELTAGVGMTYNYANKKKTFTFDASLAPISYNLKMCTNDQINETNYGIREGHTTLSKYGSTAEFKLFWRMATNITFSSRLFTFSDYDQIQSDWENTLRFEINKFLTTQIYAHLRYDSRGMRDEESKWKKLQCKEILSIGFAYKFSSI